jgi:predicted O-methyltransferase YrrM
MGKQTLDLTDDLYSYLLEFSLRETPELRALRKETDQFVNAQMQISPDQGQFMALLVKLIAAKRIIEVGTFTGYSALVMAQALPENGNIIACDTSKEWTTIAKKYWQLAGVNDSIDLRLAPALETLRILIDAGHTGHFDLVFIDADKVNIRNYFEHSLILLKAGGVVLIDNVLWSGRVIDDSDESDDTCSIRRFNEFLLHDERVDICMIPIGDGLTIARKK